MIALVKDIREEIAIFIADTPLGPGGVPAVMKMVADRFPHATAADVDAAFGRAIAILDDRAAQDEAEADALDQLAPLFDGMPDGMPLGECARIKAERGDPLALAYLEWEKQQAGGIQ